jgi:hypothetical protein
MIGIIILSLLCLAAASVVLRVVLFMLGGSNDGRSAEGGLVDADLGGGLIKQRIARVGQGKSGGYRSVIAFRRGERAVFLFGFAKNERSNIDDEELQEFKRLALVFLELNARQIATLIDDNELMEVRDDKAD